jgi:hypothetical protein
VSGTADIAVSPTSLSATVPISGQLTQTLAISNSGTADLTWSISKGCGTPEDLPWVTASPVSGTTAAGGSSAVEVTFDAADLEVDVYSGTLCVQSNDLDTPQVLVSLTLEVTGPAALQEQGRSRAVALPPSALLATAVALPVALVAGAGVRWRRRGPHG